MAKKNKNKQTCTYGLDLEALEGDRALALSLTRETAIELSNWSAWVLETSLPGLLAATYGCVIGASYYIFLNLSFLICKRKVLCED